MVLTIKSFSKNSEAILDILHRLTKLIPLNITVDSFDINISTVNEFNQFLNILKYYKIRFLSKSIILVYDEDIDEYIELDYSGLGKKDLQNYLVYDLKQLKDKLETGKPFLKVYEAAVNTHNII